MSDPVRIWLEISHHGAFRIGGWAWVRVEGAVVTGQAGGSPRLTAEGTALAGLVAALKGGGAPGPRVVHTTSSLVAAIPDRIRAAQAGENPPTEDLALWAQAMTALAANPVQIVHAPPAPDSPAAFAAAWAAFALGRAKDRGAFAAPIPKSNLAKVVLEDAARGRG